ncbi:hypothetical protein BB559_005515 [Furculomyces boomerangus]|uniref:P-loop containing nucleoside triphosphate hydrolase protein n=2 Tax=Harpellales TaxID=61421 RepID=A0A2T9Y8B2_9FUNG
MDDFEIDLAEIELLESYFQSNNPIPQKPPQFSHNPPSDVYKHPIPNSRSLSQQALLNSNTHPSFSGVHNSRINTSNSEPSTHPFHHYNLHNINTRVSTNQQTPLHLYHSPTPILSQNANVNQISGQKNNPYIQNIGLIPTDTIDPKFLPVLNYNHFNRIQSECFEVAYNSLQNFVLGAPTGSGKTGVMELSFFRMLSQPNNTNKKAIYIAPLKALCSERFKDWSNRFSKIGIESVELTGDSDDVSSYTMSKSTLVIATPEKWDVYSRKWKKKPNHMKNYELLMIDEIHTLQEPRGSVIEVIVNRMKEINNNIRIVAVSATISNIQDISNWIGNNDPNKNNSKTPAHIFRFGDDYRSVPIKKIVLGYNETRNPFIFQKNLDYKAGSVIEENSSGRPALVFCCTRKAAMDLCINLSKYPFKCYNMTKVVLNDKERAFNDKKLLECVKKGIAFHHAGLDGSDRQLVEKLYIDGKISVICTTSTLSVGVNLPAHLVVIKGTMGYNQTSFEEYSRLVMLQMIGRAGRPQFDKFGVVVVMTSKRNKDKYENMLGDGETIESS